MQDIKMVDLAGLYLRSKEEIDRAIQKVLDDTDFIQGKCVREFEQALSRYQGGANVVSCANGTDALQIAMMALEFKPGDEVILPAFTYAATAEVIALLNLVPVFADVNPEHFTLDVTDVSKRITSKTVAIVPVHLYGQSAEMEPLMKLASEHGLYVIEDGAQSLGAEYMYRDGRRQRTGCLGIIGTTSFFPTKNLGAYGDGGAIFTREGALGEKIRMIANHGQKKKYYHDMIGVNSRLDTLQAAILSVKLSHLDECAARRQAVASYYDAHLGGLDFLKIPARVAWSSHVFHQYTVKVGLGKREALKKYLEEKGIPSVVYYPLPLHFQLAYKMNVSLPVSESLSDEVLSLPIHTEMDEDQLFYICDCIKEFL